MTSILRSSAPVCAYLAALAVAFSVVMVIASQAGASVERPTPATTQPAHTSVVAPRNDPGNILFGCRTPADLVVLAALVVQDDPLGEVQHALRCGDRGPAGVGGG